LPPEYYRYLSSNHTSMSGLEQAIPSVFERTGSAIVRLYPCAESTTAPLMVRSTDLCFDIPSEGSAGFPHICRLGLNVTQRWRMVESKFYPPSVPATQQRSAPLRSVAPILGHSRSSPGSSTTLCHSRQSIVSQDWRFVAEV
jgi:hypothetical protein